MEISREVNSLSDMAYCLSYVSVLLNKIEAEGGVPADNDISFMKMSVDAAIDSLADLRDVLSAKASDTVDQVRKSPEDLYQRMEELLNGLNNRKNKLNLFEDAMWGDLDDMVWPDIGDEGIYQKMRSHCGHTHTRPVLIEERATWSDTEADSLDLFGVTWSISKSNQGA